MSYAGIAAPVSITDGQTIQLAEMCRLLGDPSRLRIVIACLATPICVSELAVKTRLSPSLVSHHLRLLRAGQLLCAERHGKQVFYAPANEQVRCTIAEIVAHARQASDPVKA
jgi:DNA-binding transcriptional ArsR family regulator